MKLSNAEMQEIDTILEKYCNTKEALSMKNFCQHGSVSTYKHVMYVTRVCYYLNKHFGLGADVKSLVVGAFLHDFYPFRQKNAIRVPALTPNNPTQTGS